MTDTRKRRKRENFIWWHRMKGHRVIRGYGLLSPASVYKCEDCNRFWNRSLL